VVREISGQPPEKRCFYERTADAPERKSLLFSLIAGNLTQRRVRSRLAPPPSTHRQPPSKALDRGDRLLQRQLHARISQTRGMRLHGSGSVCGGASAPPAPSDQLRDWCRL